MAGRVGVVLHVSRSAEDMLPRGTMEALQRLLKQLEPCLGTIALQVDRPKRPEENTESAASMWVLGPKDPEVQEQLPAHRQHVWRMPDREAAKADPEEIEQAEAEKAEEQNREEAAATIALELWRSGIWCRGGRSKAALETITAVVDQLVSFNSGSNASEDELLFWRVVPEGTDVTALDLYTWWKHGSAVSRIEELRTAFAAFEGREERLGELPLAAAHSSGAESARRTLGRCERVCNEVTLTIVPIPSAGENRLPPSLLILHRSPPLTREALREVQQYIATAVTRMEQRTRLTLCARPSLRERFENASRDLVRDLPALLLVNPRLALEVLRHLALGYMGYVRATFGTRLSRKLRHQLEKPDDEASPEREMARPASAPEPGSAAEAMEQRAFLGRMIGLGHALARGGWEEEDPHGFFASPFPAAQFPIPPLGRRLPESGLPYQRLFFQALLLDLQGTAPVLDSVLRSQTLWRGIGEVLRCDTRHGQAAARLVQDGRFDGLSRRFRTRLSLALPSPLDIPDREHLEGGAPGASRGRQGGSAAGLWVPLNVESKQPTRPDARDAWTTQMEAVLCRWLGLTTALECGALRYRHLFGGRLDSRDDEIKGEVFCGFARLWRQTHDVLKKLLWHHKEWNTVTPQSGRERNDPHGPGGGCAAEESGPAHGAYLHVDSLWLQIYLLWSMTRHITAEEAVLVHFPSPRALVTFLKRMGDLLVAVLWAELVHERNKAVFGVLSSTRTEAATADAGFPEPPLPPAPVGVDRYTEALITVVAAYAHHVIELPFEIHVARYLRQFLDRQALLYLLKDHYRDHLYHVIDVFLFGDFLLRCRLGSERVFVRDVLEELLAESQEPSSVQADASPAEVPPGPDLLRNWCVAGLFHDLGYMFLLYGKLSRELGEGVEGGPLRRFVTGMRQALRGELKNLEEAIEERFSDLSTRHPGEVLREDHGVLSGLIVDEHLRTIDWSQEETRLVRRFWPALMAICLHNLSHRKLAAREHPVGYLLALCDELQDWGRARVQRAALGRDLVWAITSPANWQLRSHPVLGELLVEVEDRPGGADFTLAGPTGVTASRGESFEPVRLDLLQIYEPADPSVLDPLFLWIGKALAFERLDHTGAPWRPQLLIISPVPERLQRLELDFRELLDRVVETAEDLNLERLANVTHEARNRLLGLRRPGGASRAGGDSAAHPLIRAVAEAVERRQPGLRRADWLLLDLQRLSEEQPLRGFAGEAVWKRLAAVKEQILFAEEGHGRPQARP